MQTRAAPGDAPGRQRWDLEAVALATLLAVVSTIPVALALQSAPAVPSPAYMLGIVDWHPIGTSDALLLALGAVVPAGLSGGAVGGWVWARRPAAAPLTALTAGWFVGIVALPVVATVTGIPLREGLSCFDVCTALLRGGDPWSGLAAYGQILITALFAIQYLLVPGVLFLLARRFRHLALWVAAGIVLHAVLHLFSIQRGGYVAYVLLTAGVVVWTGWLVARDRGLAGFAAPRRRFAVAVGGVAVAALVAAPALVSRWSPTVPLDAAQTLIGRFELSDFLVPDVAGRPPVAIPGAGHEGCLEPSIRPNGRIEVCYQAERERHENSGDDVYRVRLEVTFEGSDPGRPAWLALQLVATGIGETRLLAVWPDGAVAACGPLEVKRWLGWGRAASEPVVHEPVCGSLVSIRRPGAPDHRLFWSCGPCQPGAGEGRRLVIYEVVESSAYFPVRWEVRADLGE